MNLRKNLLVVPSDTPEPNQEHERVSLFNEDGSPFTGGGGGPILLASGWYKTGGVDVPAPPGGIYLWSIEDNPFSEAQTVFEYQKEDVIADTLNTSGIRVPDFADVYGYGCLGIHVYTQLRFPPGAASDPNPFLNNLRLEVFVANDDWSIISGEQVHYAPFVYVPQNHEVVFTSLSAQIPIVPGWSSNELGVVVYKTGTLTPDGLLSHAFSVTFTPFG